MGACFSNFYQNLPLTQYLPASINWALHGQIESPTSLRQAGLLIFMAWAIPIIIYTVKKTSSAGEAFNKLINPIYSTSLVISLFFIGVVPFFLVMNRNEQLFFPSILILIAVFIISQNKLSSNQPLKKAILGTAYLTSVALILYGHGKGLFFIPFFLLIGWSFSRSCKNAKSVFVILTLYIFACAFQAFLAWKNLYRCPEYVEFEATLKSYSIDPASLLYDTSNFLKKIYESIIRAGEYLQHIVFSGQYQVGYLPSHKLNTFEEIINLLLRVNTVLIFFCLFITIPLFYIKDFLSKRYVTINLLLLLLLYIVVGSALFNLTKNFYDASYLYSLLAIITIFFITGNKLINYNFKTTKYLVGYLTLVGVCSQIILVTNNLKIFQDGFSGPGIPIGLYENKGMHRTISLAAEACKLNLANGKHIITDDLTYGYFRKNRGPIAYTYLSFVDPSPEAYKTIFRKVEPDGMIVACSLMREDLRLRSIQTEDICCLSKSDLNKISAIKKSFKNQLIE